MRHAVLPIEETLQRARGRADVAVRVSDGAVRLERLFQQGAAKVRLPKNPDPTPEAVFINTAGGLAGGDRFEVAFAAGPGAALVATTQAAERVYRSTGATARVALTLRAGPGARLDWLPQETILFDRGRLERRLELDMAADARVTLLESFALGRAAMGETVRMAHFCDQWRLRRDGRLVHAEALRLSGDFAALAGPALLAGPGRTARAGATLVHLAPDAGDRLDRARALLAGLADPAVTAAASVKAGVLILRFLAPDHAPLRATLARFLAAFRDAPPPRVWNLTE